ncbi:MAG: hypothetical protein RL095_3173 [Verrucomicrobiota bacterium]
MSFLHVLALPAACLLTPAQNQNFEETLVMVMQAPLGGSNDGAAGADGQPGKDGAAGADGQPGKDGAAGQAGKDAKSASQPAQK